MTDHSRYLGAVARSRIGIATHGIPGGIGPAEQLYEFLTNTLQANRVEYIRFPLAVPHADSLLLHQGRSSAGANFCVETSRKISPPASYPLDLVDRRTSNCDIWITFDPLLAAKACAWPGRSKRCVVSWHVDFAPDRGSGFANAAYRLADSYSYQRSDLQIDISDAARTARQRLYPNASTPHIVIPFATSAVPDLEEKISKRNHRTVVFAGALERRTGAHLLPRIAEGLRHELGNVKILVIGDGSLRSEIAEEVTRQGLADSVELAGFVDSHDEMLSMLTQCDVALAPYDKEFADFSQYSDPGKIKTYLSCGLPVITNQVATNHAEILSENAGLVLEDNHPSTWVNAVVHLLRDTRRLNNLTAGSLVLGSSYQPEAVYTVFASALGHVVLGDNVAMPGTSACLPGRNGSPNYE